MYLHRVKYNLTSLMHSLSLTDIATASGTAVASLPHAHTQNFRGVRGPDRFLYGMVCDAQRRLDELLAVSSASRDGVHALRIEMATMLRETEWPWSYPPLYEPY